MNEYEDLQEGNRSLYQAKEHAEGTGGSSGQAEEAQGHAWAEVSAPGKPYQMMLLLPISNNPD